MASPASARATFVAEAADADGLRAALGHLVRVGFSEAPVRDRLGLADLKDLNWRALPIYRLECLAGRDPQACAIDLFLLQGSLTATELDSLFAPAIQALLARTGVLTPLEAGVVRARASLYPVGQTLVFSDHAWPQLPHPGCRDVPHDQVMFVGSDSRWLARATSRHRIEAALDLCTGSGIHAVLAASHARRVVAVDINPRAILCTRFNALAAGAAHVEVAEGNLFEPVRGQRFDLITANPPFVPSPILALGYRDGGPSGDDVQQGLVAQLPAHLAPHGLAQIVTEVGERDDASVAVRVRAWLGDAPIDLVVLRLHEVSAASYATGHAQGDDDYGAFLDSVQAWHANLKAQGYVRVVSVLLALRWSDPALGAPWTRMESVQAPSSDANDEIEAIFAAERLVRAPDLFDALERGQVWRAGPIALLDACALDGRVPPTTQAKLLGKAMPRQISLAPLERDLMLALETPLAVADLIAQAASQGLTREALLTALQSLLRQGLVAFARVAVDGIR
ncbi:MAG: methyltransferase small [Cyanobacteria bacterium RYN_339]|nr:methyltransferase small [Cyanobacteria bacterium RYN_339]